MTQARELRPDPRPPPSRIWFPPCPVLGQQGPAPFPALPGLQPEPSRQTRHLQPPLPFFVPLEHSQGQLQAWRGVSPPETDQRETFAILWAETTADWRAGEQARPAAGFISVIRRGLSDKEKPPPRPSVIRRIKSVKSRRYVLENVNTRKEGSLGTQRFKGHDMAAFRGNKLGKDPSQQEGSP